MHRVGSPLPKYLLGVFFGMFVPLLGTAQEVKSLDLPTYPIEMTEGSCTPESYSFLGEVIGEARVVALGEASHGTGTITEQKRCLIAYLVEQKGFSVVAFEAFYTMTNRANDYIQGERKALAPSHVTWGTQEVYNFFVWARDYNLSHSTDERFRAVGVDVYANLETAEDVLQFIERVDPAFLNQARASYRDILALYSGDDPRKDSYTYIQKARAVSTHLNSRRQAYLASDSEAQVERGLHSAEVVVQGLLRAFEPSRERRDAFMAKNVQALLQDHEKVVFWAHNQHIRESPTPSIAAGTRLAEALGDDYVSVATTFSEGTNSRVIADRRNFSNCLGGEPTDDQKKESERRTISCVERVPPPREGSLEAFLLNVSLTNTFIDLRSDKPLPPPLAKSIAMRDLGTISQAESYQFTNLGENYDALIFLEEVSAATLFQSSNPSGETNP